MLNMLLLFNLNLTSRNIGAWVAPNHLRYMSGTGFAICRYIRGLPQRTMGLSLLYNFTPVVCYYKSKIIFLNFFRSIQQVGCNTKRLHKHMKHSILILGLLISFNLFGQNLTKMELEYIPDSTKTRIKSMAESDFLAQTHFSTGMWIRNYWLYS